MKIIEETGITPSVGRLLFVQQFSSPRQDREEELEFFFHITNPEDFAAIDLGTTTHGASELTRIEFIAPTEHLLPQFLQTIDIDSYISEPRPVFLFSELSRQV